MKITGNKPVRALHGTINVYAQPLVGWSKCSNLQYRQIAGTPQRLYYQAALETVHVAESGTRVSLLAKRKLSAVIMYNIEERSKDPTENGQSAAKA